MSKAKSDAENFDVLIYLSDQHTASISGFMHDRIVDTPNLDAIAGKGVVFDNAYTSCPLCVPARASFMTARIPSRLGVFNNDSDFKSSEITFAHLLALKGYESTLIGRMHFNGMDFNHGFTQRLGNDLTSSYWGNPAHLRKDLGGLRRCFYQRNCLEILGEGDSPVLEFDRQTVETALEYLNNDYEKSQLMVVGTYGPHFPYVCDAKLMGKYREKIQENFINEDIDMDFVIPTIQEKIQQASKEEIIELRAAYYAMIEVMDTQIGQVYVSFKEYLKRNNRKGIFIYMSDHGDQIGFKNLYGKQTFFEKSAKIPLVFLMDGVEPRRVSDSVSIMDIGPTLCDLVGAESFPNPDGISLVPALNGETMVDHCAVSEFYEMINKKCILGRMVHKNQTKLISYDGFEEKDLLFDTKNDPLEKTNIKNQNPDLYKKMRKILEASSVWTNRKEIFIDDIAKFDILKKVGYNQKNWNHYTYQASESVRHAFHANFIRYAYPEDQNGEENHN